MCMKRLQILIPEETYARLKKEAKRREWTVAEVVRRGLERQLESAVDGPPGMPQFTPRSLGPILAPESEWRELANVRYLNDFD
jgi:hypothetical protein